MSVTPFFHFLRDIGRGEVAGRDGTERPVDRPPVRAGHDAEPGVVRFRRKCGLKGSQLGLVTLTPGQAVLDQPHCHAGQSHADELRGQDWLVTDHPAAVQQAPTRAQGPGDVALLGLEE